MADAKPGIGPVDHGRRVAGDDHVHGMEVTVTHGLGGCAQFVCDRVDVAERCVQTRMFEGVRGEAGEVEAIAEQVAARWKRLCRADGGELAGRPSDGAGAWRARDDRDRVE
jgi:hypothetical protein